MSTNYDGLTRNIWPGTWSTGTNAPIALDTELRGTLQSISGDSGDRLTDIPGARIQEGMLVYLKTGYTAGAVTRDSDTYYTYKLQGGESRSAITGAVPNAEANWAQIDLSGANGATGVTGASGVAGASGISGASGYVGSDGATGVTGASGVAGATGVAGASGYVGSDGATGVAGADALWNFTGAYNAGSAYAVGDVATYSGQTWYRINSNGGNVGDTPAEGTFWTLIAAHGATGVQGATGAGLVQTTFVTSSTDEVVFDTLNSTLYRSAKYEIQMSGSSQFGATEIRLLVDDPNVFITQYGSIGEVMGTFASYYSPLNNSYSSPNINTGSVSFWNGTSVRIYTTDNSVILGLMSIPVGETITLNGSITFTLSSTFSEISSGIYGANSVETRSPTLLISNISWTGSGDIELRFTPINAITTIKYIRTTIDV